MARRGALAAGAGEGCGADADVARQKPGRRGREHHGGRDAGDPPLPPPEGRGPRRHGLAPERPHHFFRGGVSVRRRALEAAQDGLLPDGRQIRNVAAWRRRGLLELLQRDGEGRVALERLLARDHLVDDHAERVDVGRRRDLPPLDLLGRHVIGRPDHGLGLGQRGGGADAAPSGPLASGESEVRDDRAQASRAARVGLEHDVGALEVPVDHARLVGRGERRRHLFDERLGFLRAQTPAVRKPLGERDARKQLHRQEGERLVVEHVEGAADVGVRDAAREVDFAEEAFHRPRVVRDVGADGLQGHALAQDLVLRLVDLTHAAAGDEADDAEAPGQDLALGEPRRSPHLLARSGRFGRDGRRINRAISHRPEVGTPSVSRSRPARRPSRCGRRRRPRGRPGAPSTAPGERLRIRSSPPRSHPPSCRGE